MSFVPSQKNIILTDRIVFSLAVLVTLSLLAVLVKVGTLGILAAVALMTVTVLTPLLINRYGLFLFIWLFIAPSFDNLRSLLVAGTNPAVFLITGLTLPFAFFLLGRDMAKVMKNLPFTRYLLLFNGVLFLNLFRPDAESGILLECLKLFFELFVIFCGYRVIMSGKPDKLFSQVNWFMILNSGVAFFQRLTGLGLSMIEGVPRVGGLVGHPNCLAFLNALYIPFGIYQALHAKTRQQRVFWLIGVIASSIVLVMTMCKNVIACMLLDYVILFLCLPNALKRRCLAALAVLIATLLGMNALFHFNLFTLLSERVSNNDSMAWRFKIWGQLLGNMDLPNMLIGHGVNAGKALVHRIVPSDSSFIHNIYIQLWYEYGATGILLILAFLQPSVTFLCALCQRNPDQNTRINSIFPLLILLTILINMATDNSVFLRTPMCFAWLFLTYFYLHSRKQVPNL
jgi:O-antigen ligase